MIEQNHYAASDIQMKVKLLQNNFSRVKELVEIRGDRLNDAAQSLQVKPRQFLRLIINTLSYRLISLDMESFLQEYLLVLFLNYAGSIKDWTFSTCRFKVICVEFFLFSRQN